MPHRPLTPSSIHPPLARYAHAVLVPGGSVVVRSSGQLGIAADGQIPATTYQQLALIFANISAILTEAGMEPRNICHMTAWLTDRADLPVYMSARDDFLGPQAVPAASTLLLVAGFSRPEFKVEVEFMAAADSLP